MRALKKYLSIDVIMAGVILLIIGIMAFNGYVMSNLSATSLRYPTFVFTVCLVIGTLEIVKGVRKNARTEFKMPVFTNKRNFFFVCGAIIVYASLLTILGFIIASSIFTISYILYTRYEKPVRIIVTSLVIVIVIYVVFTQFLHVNLPQGLILRVIFN